MCSSKSALVFNCKPEVDQGVITYMSPVEAFVSGIKIFDQQKVCLIAGPSGALDHLIFLRVKGQIITIRS